MKRTYTYASPPETVSKAFLETLAAWKSDLVERCASLPRHAVCDLEIGCGHGHFLADYAAAHPDRTCVGVDIDGGRLKRAEKKGRRLGLRNLHGIRAEALLFLECLPGALRFERVFILFPDPWPKRRHHKHRLIQPRFLEALSAACRPGASLYFRTDHRGYWEQSREALSASPFWELFPSADWPWEAQTVFQERAAAYDSLVARKTPQLAPEARAAQPEDTREICLTR